MIDIVGTDHRAEKLLHVIGIFIGASGATDAGKRIRAVLGDDFLKFMGYQIQSLIPGSFPELAVFLDQRRFKAFVGINEIKSVSSFDTQSAFIRFSVFDAGHLDNFTVLHMQQLLTSDTAIGTGGAYLGRFPRPPALCGFLLEHAAHGTYLHTLTAGNAFIPVKSKLGCATRIIDVYGADALYFLAGIDTTQT